MTDGELIAQAIKEVFTTTGDRNITDAIYELAYQLDNLGNADARSDDGSRMGALELLGMTLKEQLESISNSLGHIASAIEPEDTSGE